MATLTKGKTFTNGELVTPQKLHELVDLGSVANIVNADISAAAAIADTKLAQITTAGKVANSATTATNASTANAIVARDGSGNFSAGTITASLSGNAATATTLQTTRTINGVSFNGGANITITADPNSHTHGAITNLGAIGTTAGLPIITGTNGVLQSGSFGSAVGSFCQGSDSRLSDSRTPTDASVTNAKVSATAAIADTKLATISASGKVSNSATTATNANTGSAIVARDVSGNFSAGTITASLSGNAATATTLQTTRTINGVSFNGGANITITADPNSHTHGAITNLGAIGTTAGLPIITGTNGVLQSGSFGSAVGSFCQGSDSRLSDSRTPTDASVTNAKVSATAAIADTKLATISASGKVSNSATTATNANTGSAIVARDVSGNFSAGTITASLSGNATTATTLQTTRTINGVSFNGSADITVTADPNSHTHDDRYYTETEVNTLLTDKQKINGKTISIGLNWNSNTGIEFSNIPSGVQKFTLLVEIWLHGYSSAPGQGVVNIGTTTSGGLITWNTSGGMANPYYAAVNNIEDSSGFPITGGANTAAEHVGVLNFYVTNDPSNPTTKKRLICESHITQKNSSTNAITILQGTGWIDYTGEINQFVLRPRFNSNSVSSAAARLYYYY